MTELKVLLQLEGFFDYDEECRGVFVRGNSPVLTVAHNDGWRIIEAEGKDKFNNTRKKKMHIPLMGHSLEGLLEGILRANENFEEAKANDTLNL